MNIEKLKYCIINKETLPNVLIFKYSSNESEFIFNQYLREYSNYSGYNIKHVDDLSEISNSLFDSVSNNVYVYDVKKLDSIPQTTNNIWIKCKSVSSRLKDCDIIDIPKLEEWQIKDFIETLTKLDKDICDKLYNNYKNNLFRLDLEIEKLKLFNDPSEVYNKIENQLYIDSAENSIFDVTNCIIRRDVEALKKMKLDTLDIDVFGLIKILLTNFRYVIDIQLAINSTPEYVGVSSKQFWAIKNYSCNFYSKEELVYIYRFLLTIEDKIKLGYINSLISIDYIICKIMLLGGN